MKKISIKNATEEEIKELANKIIANLTNPETTQKLRDNSKEFENRLRKFKDIDPMVLKKPCS